MKLSRLIAIALLAAGCARVSGDGPAIDRLEPPGTYASGPVAVTIRGSNFVPGLIARQNGGGGIDVAGDGGVDSQFQAWLDDQGLADVKWIDQSTLTATVPQLSADGGLQVYDLKVAAPYGTGTKPQAFKVSTRQPAQLSATVNAPARVTTLNEFDVSMTVVNGGQSQADDVKPALTPAGVATAVAATDELGASVPVEGSLAGGASRVLTWHFKALTTAGTYPLALSATGTDEVDGRTLSTGGNASIAVVAPASLTAVAQIKRQGSTATFISSGETVTLEVTVNNSGGSDASNVEVEASVDATRLQLGPKPPAQDIAAGTAGTFTFNLTGRASGLVSATAKVAGVDSTGGAALAAPDASSSVTVQSPAALTASVSPLALPRRAVTGSKHDFSVTVQNTGEATARSVLPNVTVSGGGVLLPLDTSARDLAGGEMATFAYEFDATLGNADFSASPSGGDANSGNAIQIGPQPLGSVVVEAPANLTLTAATSKQLVTTGQLLTLTLTVTNDGDATASGVLPSVTAPGLQVGAASPPSAQDIPGHSDAKFTYSVSGGAPIGTANISASVSASDADSGSPLFVQASGGPVTVVAPAQLKATAKVAGLPLSISIGQPLTLELTVQNDGGADATNVNATGADPLLQPSAPAPAAQDIPAGAQKTFTFQLQGQASGNALFTAGAVGTDVISGNQVSTLPAVRFPSIAVQTPALLVFTADQVPQRASIDEDVSFNITVTNQGEATATNVQPQVQVTQTGTVVSVGALPPAITLAGKASTIFACSFHAAAGGTATFSASVTGNDANTSIPLNPLAQAMGDVTVEAAASLTVQMSAPSQVSTGQAGLSAAVTVANSGSATALNVVPQLEAAGGVAADAPSPAAQDIPGGGQATFTFPLHAVSPGNATITPSAAGTDANSNQQIGASLAASSILVQTPAALHIASVAIPPALSTGQIFNAVLAVQNNGGAVATPVTPALQIPGNVTIVTPPGPKDIAGGDSATFIWTLQAGASAGQVVVTASVNGADQNTGALLSDGPTSSNSAALQLKAALNATLTIPTSLSRGQSFTATLTVQNDGDVTARQVMPQPDPPQAVEQVAADAQTSDTEQAVDIPGHESRTFTWSFTENGTGSGSFKLQVGAAGTDQNSGQPAVAPDATTDAAVVQEPAALAIDSLTLSPAAQVSRGQAFTVNLTVRNTGEAVAAQVSPSPLVPSIAATGGALAITPPDHQQQDIAGGAAKTFSWTFVENGTGSGSLSLSGGAVGLDQNSGASVSAAAAQSAALTVQEPAALSALVAAPARISRGQTFQVSVTVTNSGEAVAAAVDPGLQLAPAGAATLSLSPSTPVQEIAGGASATFSYTVHEISGAEAALSWSAIPSGMDANSGLTVTSSPASAATAVDAPAALAISAFTLPSAITRGTSITAQLVVTNTGDAAALHVLPSTPVPQTTGGASASTATSVAAVDLPGHQTATFSWTFSENGAAPGTLGLASTVSAADANSNAPIVAPATASPVPVQDPSQLEIVSFSLPAKLSRGQAFSAALTVRNAGTSSNIDNITAATPAIQTTGGAGATTSSAPSIASLAPGQSGTLTWSYTENGTAPGTLQLSALVNGTDSVLSVAVSSNAGSGAAVVQAPASLTLSLLTLPSRIARGQQFNAQLTVQNTGGATAASVTPAALALAFAGGAHATVNATPAAQDIAGGASATFSWTLIEDGTASGSLSATASVTAADANSAAALAPAPLSAGPVPVEHSAVLGIVSLTAPAAVTRGQSFTVTLLVNNSGEAGARVTPGILGITPAASATIVSTAAAANVAGGASSSFSWNVTSVAGSASTSLAFSVSVTGRDLDSNALLTAGPANAGSAVNTAPQLVVQSFALRSASGGTAINRGETFTADLTVVNNGQATAISVLPTSVPPALSATGGAAASTASPASPATLAGGQSTTFHWSYAESGSAAGTIALSTGLSGLDANSGAAVSAAPAGSNTLLVQNPSALSSTLSVAASIGLNTTFTVSLAVQNTGDATAKNVAPSLTASGTGGVAQLTSPAAADVAGGTTTTFQWTYGATANGSLSLAATASGADANDAAVRTTNASAATSITDAALLATDAFGDGSPFAYVFEYSGRVFVGPRSTGVGAVSMQPDGTGPQSETFLFNGAANDLNDSSDGPFPSLGYSGCTANTAQCGPDNENGRGDFYAGVLGTTEMLFGAGTRSTGPLKHIYSTSQTTSSKLFGAIGLSAQAADANTRGVTSMLAVGSRLYVGFAEVGGGTNGASNLSLAWSDNASAANPTFTNSALDTNQLDGVGTANRAHVQLVDSMVVFNGLLYLANNGGCERATVTKPGPWDPGLLNLGLLTGPEDWASCTPSSSQWGLKTSVTTTKTTDFTPADRAVPQMAVFNGRLYLARNTTTGPQLWVCNPGSDNVCDPNNWSLIAANSTGDTSLSTFNDTTVTAISLLAATPSHLYVGYDSSAGVSLFRSNTASPVNRADFVGQSSCPAANHPATCAGLNGTGLGKGLTRFWSDAVMTFSGTDYLYVSAGTGSVGASVYRVAQ